MRLRKGLSIAALVCAVVFTAAVTYLFTADLGRHREWIESIGSNIIGRKLSIEGEFHLRLGRMIRLSAARIRLANAPWSVHPDMLQVNQLALQVDLWSLFSRPVRIQTLSVNTAQVSVERNNQYQFNWTLARQRNGRSPMIRKKSFFLDHFDARRIAIALHRPGVKSPVNIQLDSVQITEDQQERLNLSMETHLGKYNGTIQGFIGPFPSLLKRRNLTFALKGDSNLATFNVTGGIVSLKELEQPDIKLTAVGPEVEAVTALLGLPTIAQGAFKVTGTITGRSGNIDVKLDAYAGKLNAKVQLDASNLKRSPVFNLETQARGPNLGEVARLLGIKGIPQQPFTLAGRAHHDVSGTALEKIQLKADSIDFLVDGHLGKAPDYQDTLLTMKAQGADISAFREALGLNKMRAANFSFTGRVEHNSHGLVLKSGQLKVAKNVIQAKGALGTLPNLDGADIAFSLAAPNLATLGVIAGIDKLPQLPVNGEGHITQSAGIVALNSVELDLGVATVTSHGTVTRRPKGEGSKLYATIAGKNLFFLGNELGIKQLPSLPFKVKLSTEFQKNSVALQGMDATVGSSRLTGNGKLDLRYLTNAHFTLSAQGPDLGVLLFNIKNAPTLDIPFKLQCELVTSDVRISVQKLNATIGSTRVSAQGTLGTPPRFGDMNLKVKLSGKSLAESLKPFDITENVPNKSFEFSGRVKGSSKRVALAAQTRVGKDHGSGDITFEPGHPARLTLRLDADTLDLRPLLTKVEVVKPAKKPKSSSPDNKLLVPDTPLPMKWIEDLLASVEIKVSHLSLKTMQLHDFSIVGTVKPGLLDIKQIKGSTDTGQVYGALLIRKQDDGVQVDLNGHAEGTKLFALPDSTIPTEQLPPVVLDISLSGHGRSLHGLASNVNGRIQLLYGSGHVENRTGSGLLTSSLFAEIFRTLNPFDKRQPYTQLQCGIIVADAKDGIVTTDTVLLQTDKVLLTTKGQLNLKDESLDAVFSTKPREGLGISIAGAFNHYLKVSGTLANWQLTLNPTGAAIAGGAAAATGGLSVLAESLWGRIISGGNVCGKELKNRGLRLPGSK